MSLLANKGQWDGLLGAVDIQTDQYVYVVLPRYVDGIVAINQNSYPSEMKNRLFEYHINGPGQNWTPCGSWMDVGTTPVFRNLDYIQNLVAIPDDIRDENIQFRVYGYANNREIFTYSEDTTDTPTEKGFLVDCNQDGSIKNPVSIQRIERIVKPKTYGHIQLISRDTQGSNEVSLGYYAPDETEPMYRKIKLSHGCNTVRVLYRKKSLKISSLTDPLHLRSRLAVINAARAILAQTKGDYKTAEIAENKAMQYLNEDKMARDPSQTFRLQIDRTVGASHEHAQY
jgi:hypothetical protein